MKGKRYTKEFKEMVIQEANEVNDVAQVARRHELDPKTIYRWRSEVKHKAWEVTERDKGTGSSAQSDSINHTLRYPCYPC